MNSDPLTVLSAPQMPPSSESASSATRVATTKTCLSPPVRGGGERRRGGCSEGGRERGQRGRASTPTRVTSSTSRCAVANVRRGSSLPASSQQRSIASCGTSLTFQSSRTPLRYTYTWTYIPYSGKFSEGSNFRILSRLPKI